MRPLPPRQNYLGPRGWVWGGKYGLERYLYFGHRVTGLGLILYGIIHLVTTTAFRIQGEGVWEATMTLFDNPWFKVGEYLVIVAFIYHALNGLRLVIQELGFGLGRPTPPIYPYQDALRQKRPATIAMMAVMLFFALIFFFDLIIGGW